MEALPWEIFTGVDLANRRNIAVREHALRGNTPSSATIETQFDDGLDLQVWKIRQPARVPGIGDLDADRGRVDIDLPHPEALTRVPGAIRLAHELLDASVFMHEVVTGDLAFRRAKPLQRAVRRCHAGVMQEDDVRGASACPFAEIRRRRGCRAGIVTCECALAAQRSFSIAS